MRTFFLVVMHNFTNYFFTDVDGLAGVVLLLLIQQSHVHVVAMESSDSFKPPLMLTKSSVVITSLFLITFMSIILIFVAYILAHRLSLLVIVWSIYNNVDFIILFAE